MIGRIIGLICLLSIVSCSAIELNEQNQQATTQAEANIAGTVESRIATETANNNDINATLDSVSAQATTDADDIDDHVSATLTAIAVSTLDAETTPDPESTAEVTADPEATTDPESTAEPAVIPSSADVTVFGTVPIDSDSLNSITALTFDADGNLLVSLRNGDIYRLIDDDNDDTADEVTLVFEDSDDDIGQVSGILVEGDLLYIVSGAQLSVIQDTDGDGNYDAVTELSDNLPDNQALLQANNSIIQVDDRRYMTADVSSGDIVLITVGDE